MNIKVFFIVIALLFPISAMAQTVPLIGEPDTSECRAPLAFLMAIEGMTVVNISKSQEVKLSEKVDRPDVAEPYEMKLTYMADKPAGRLVIIKDDCIVSVSPLINVRGFMSYLTNETDG